MMHISVCQVDLLSTSCKITQECANTTKECYKHHFVVSEI